MNRPPALLLVDLQNDYLPGGLLPVPGIESAVANAARLLERFRANRWPRFHVQHVAKRAGAGFFLPGTRGVEFQDAVAPAGDEPVILKHVPNGFRETTLFDDLHAARVGELVVCGAMSQMCIDAAVRHAADFGFAVTVVHDACAARAVAFNGRTVASEDVHAAFMGALGAYARVCSLAELEATLPEAALAA